jgi:primosomal protein N' (replication factor Y)
VARDPCANRSILRTSPLDPMPEQAEALRRIAAVVDRCASAAGDSGGAGRHVVLLYGITGSGKTEVYLQAIAHARRLGRGAIVLVPEISLTPQTVELFVARFGEEVAVLHSRLSDGERHDEWHRIQAGQAPIVVGARSAVFAPVSPLGIVIVDEEHEPSYKQDESPRYHARDVAVMRGRLERCAVVLGSATPSLESWVNARNGKYELARLPRRVDDRKLPVMRIVDMRVETQAQGKVSLLSRPLVEAIRARLDKAQQVILFLNRRGFASSLTCPKCGFVAQCDSCSVAFTYHRVDERLLCHICGSARPVPPNCPKCGDAAFRFAGAGTQRVESVVRLCFPHAKVQRMDADTTSRRHAHADILGDFRVGKTDILIGTQMIAKGLHFPNVTLVGVVNADMGLNLPDFRAGERSFQLFAQVAGRAGRGEVPGEVIVQTSTPFHNAIQAARRLDFEGFCDQEMEFRRELGYPPFGRLTCVTFKGRNEARVAFLAGAFGDKWRGLVSPRVTVAAACPAPLAKAKEHYRFQVMARGPSARELADPLRETVRQVPMPPDVTCAVDVDAVDLL